MGVTRRETIRGGAAGVFAAMGAACAKATRDAPTEINGFDAVETALRIKERDIKPAEAVEAAIVRAEAAEPMINAIVTPTFEAAREGADRKGALGGAPTFVKDLVDVAGQPTKNGSRAFADYVAQTQPPFIDGLEAAGLVILGKSATPEFGLTATTEPMLGGPTRNPWNTDHSAGGSSGGAAALVAAGVVPLAHASDGGGSIRIPASCCGTVGLKVSNDRYPPVRDESKIPVRISVQGCETRSVRDTAAFLAAMELTDGPLEPVGLVAGPSSKRLKIGVFTDGATGAPVHPDVVAAIASRGQAVRRSGPRGRRNCAALRGRDRRSFSPLLGEHRGRGDHGMGSRCGPQGGRGRFRALHLWPAGILSFGRGRDRPAIKALIAFKETYRQIFASIDVLLSPVLSAPPPPIGYLATDGPFEETLERLVGYAQFTAPANISGAASISLPLGQSTDGLPIGALFSGPVGSERTLLELAFELEEAAPWAGRKPAVSSPDAIGVSASCWAVERSRLALDCAPGGGRRGALMRRLVSALIAGLCLGGCTTMELFDTLSVVSEAYAIKQCREGLDKEESPYSYAACENDW